MKLLVPILALLGLTSVAPSAQLYSKRAATCDTTSLSCHTTGTVDSCCSPWYGLVVLALQWVPGYGPNYEFNIHGLWPDTCTGGLLSSGGCDSSRSSTTIATYLVQSFWSHEWTKHGTCVRTLRPTCYGSSYQEYEDVTDYFKQVLDLRDRIDIFGVLNTNGVSVGNTYNVETIRSAIKKFYDANAKLDCTDGALTYVYLNFYIRGKNTYEVTEDYIADGSCEGAVYFPQK